MAEPKSIPVTLTQQEIERFWGHVERRGLDECWPWLRRLSRGYGKFTISRRGSKYLIGAHRIAYLLGHNEDPADMLVCHRCDNPPCCNPAHLFKGTPKDNLADCSAKGRTARLTGDRHWSKKHPNLISRGSKVGGSVFTDDQVREIFTLYLTGEHSHQSIADRFSVNRETVSVILRGRNWKHLNPDPEAMRRISHKHRGDSSRQRARLSPDDVRYIRSTYADGETTLTELASRYGVTPAMIGHIVRGRAYRDVA